MIFCETEIPGAFILKPERFEDERGYFVRTFCQHEFKEKGISFSPVQGNISNNKTAFTLRGMHFHTPPYEETKLVRCSAGRLFDVAVDLRLQSPAYKKWVGVELSRENGFGFFIPAGCAHGFLTLEDDTDVSYQMSPLFEAGHDKGIHWQDPEIGIHWPDEPRILSEKDKQLPKLADL